MKLKTRREFEDLKKTKAFKTWLRLSYGELKGICPECSERMGRRTADGIFSTTDHIVELANGGTNDYSNFRVICNLCNNKKDHLRVTKYFSERVKGTPRNPKSYETENESLSMQVWRYVF